MQKSPVFPREQRPRSSASVENVTRHSGTIRRTRPGMATKDVSEAAPDFEFACAKTRNSRTISVCFYLSSPVRKNISIPTAPKSLLYPQPSRPTEGRIAIVTDAGRDVVDADALSARGIAGRVSREQSQARGREMRRRTVKSCGPDASTPASSLAEVCRPNRARTAVQIREATVTRKPDRRGDHEVSR
jgi:hypothetical protein